MKNIKLLDCTLRDGGYVNDWEFGHSVITGTYKRLDAAGVDYIEVGFLDDRREFDFNRSITPNTEGFNRIFSGVKKQHAIPVAMIDFGTCSIENIQDSKDTFIEGIRVIFKKERIEEALPFCKQIKDKGYKLFIQAISITSYSDKEMLEYIEKINQIKPYVFSIVDTYGLLDDRKLKKYFYLIDNNLDSSIKIGYHAHNNFQLAFSNSIKFLATETTRELIVDSTVYGMGKSAGNTASELIALHMNDWYGTSYDINQFLEILDTDLMSIYYNHYWGYKYNFYISARQRCHPNYVQYLLDKKTLSITSINEILSKIPPEIKLHFKEDVIESLYINYQSKIVDDVKTIKTLINVFSNEKVLLMGPGGSIEKEKEQIDSFIAKEKPIIIMVNFGSNIYKSDYVFVSNSKRYSKLADSFFVGDKEGAKLISTSNVSLFDKRTDRILNYSSLMEMNGVKSDNALLLSLAMLIKSGVKEAYLAGFDGFRNDKSDYFDPNYSFVGNEKYNIEKNSVVVAGLKKLSNTINLHFLTHSLYEEGL